MRNTIKIFLGVWSFLVLLCGIRILIPGMIFFQDSSILQQIQSFNNTGIIFVWAALLSLFLSLEKRSDVIPASPKVGFDNPFDFHEKVFRQYENRCRSNKKWEFGPDF